MESFDSYIGNVLGERYTLINIIGVGEYSVVFGAYDSSEDRTVALKILRPEFNDDPTVFERFTTEANVMSVISHPNIVKFYDSSLEGDLRYFVMEYIEGITLKKHILGKGALDVDEIIFLSRQILSALEAVHEKGIVHSDIKPQNVVLLPDGHVYLMDFGISKMQNLEAPSEKGSNMLDSVFSDAPTSDEENESSEFAVGTVHYVSPEQAEGRPVDHQSDLYSFGVMLYEMTTGILPFFGESAYRIALMHVRLQPLEPTRLDPSIPTGLEQIILRAMEKLPAARFATAREMREALDAFDLEYHTEEAAQPAAPQTLPQKAIAFMGGYFKKFNLPSFVMGALCALLVALVVGLGITSSAVLSERENPTHVKVPSLKGKELTAAEEWLDDDWYEFRVTYVTSNEHQGRIIKQSPAAGTVKKLDIGEKCVIDVTVSRRSLPPIMPDFKLLPYDQVADVLRAYDCEVSVVKQASEYVEEGTILNTSPAAGSPSSKNITLYVSSGWQKAPATE